MICIKCLAKNLTIFKVHENFLLERITEWNCCEKPQSEREETPSFILYLFLSSDLQADTKLFEPN